jgi:hypothetical protein
MLLNNVKLLKEYYKKIRHKYPELSEDQIRECCRYPFVHANRCMASDNMEEIRLKYLGVFTIPLRRLKYWKRCLDKSLAEGRVSKEKYLKTVNKLNEKAKRTHNTTIK